MKKKIFPHVLTIFSDQANDDSLCNSALEKCCLARTKQVLTDS